MEGALKNPSALDKLGDLYLVLDASKNTVTAYAPTAYAQGMDQAIAYHYADDYAREAEMWEEVLSLNGNSDVAYTGMGKAAFSSLRM